jgi:hypothetical protein
MPPLTSLGGFEFSPGIGYADLSQYLQDAGAPERASESLQQVASFWFETSDTVEKPTRGHFRPETLTNILPDLFIIDLISPGVMRYRLVGTRLADNFPTDPTTRLVGSLDAGWGDMVVQPIAELISSTLNPHLFLAYPAPGISEAPLATAVALPLFGEDGVINMVLGAAVFGSPIIQGEAPPTRVAKVELLP